MSNDDGKDQKNLNNVRKPAMEDTPVTAASVDNLTTWEAVSKI